MINKNEILKNLPKGKRTELIKLDQKNDQYFSSWGQFGISHVEYEKEENTNAKKIKNVLVWQEYYDSEKGYYKFFDPEIKTVKEVINDIRRNKNYITLEIINPKTCKKGETVHVYACEPIRTKRKMIT